MSNNSPLDTGRLGLEEEEEDEPTNGRPAEGHSNSQARNFHVAVLRDVNHIYGHGVSYWRDWIVDSVLTSSPSCALYLPVPVRDRVVQHKALQSEHNFTVFVWNAHGAAWRVVSGIIPLIMLSNTARHHHHRSLARPCLEGWARAPKLCGAIFHIFHY